MCRRGSRRLTDRVLSGEKVGSDGERANGSLVGPV